MQDVTLRKPRTSRKTLGPVQWLLQVSTGIFLIFFVWVHLYLAHINFGHPIVFYNTVLENMHNPWWLLFYIAFVWIVAYHALNGVKGIIYDTGVKGNHGNALKQEEEELVMLQPYAHLIQCKPEAVCAVIEYNKRKQDVKNNKEVIRPVRDGGHDLIVSYLSS